MSTIAKLILGVGFIIFVMSLGYYVATNNSSEDYQRLSSGVEELRGGNEVLRAENVYLQAQIEAMRTDSRIIERRIRDDLGMVRRDEILILLNQEQPR